MFTLGRFSRVRGPGLIFLLPWVQQIVRVDLRTVVMEIPGQDLISRDNVSVKVDAVLYFHVVDPEKAIIQVEQYSAATNMLAQTTFGRSWASTNSMRCSQSVRRSIPMSKTFSMLAPRTGASK
jgi:regulator of protease activity HflC (stomatin/prohibitin superfamily)